MTDAADETPIQRALRLKKAAIQARPSRGASGGRKENERAAAAVSSSKSKPWMSR